MSPWGALYHHQHLGISEVFALEVFYFFYACVLFVGVGHLFVFIDFSSLETDLCVNLCSLLYLQLSLFLTDL